MQSARTSHSLSLSLSLSDARVSTGFNDDCIKVLVERNPHLFDLQLSELGRMNDASLSLLHPLTNLTSLDLSRAGVDQGKILTDSSIISLLSHVGHNLITLNLDRTFPFLSVPSSQSKPYE